MIQYLSFFDFLMVGISVILELSLFFYLTDRRFRAARFFMLYCAARNIVLIPFMFGTLKVYAYAYWPSQMVKLSWLAWLAATVICWYSGFQFDWATKAIAKIPAVVVLGLSLYALPPGPTAAMQRYEDTAWGIIVMALVVGLLLSLKDRTAKIALGISSLSAVGLGANQIWEHIGYSSKTWEAGWILALLLLIISLVNGSSRSVPQRVLRVFRATQNDS